MASNIGDKRRRMAHPIQANKLRDGWLMRCWVGPQEAWTECETQEQGVAEIAAFFDKPTADFYVTVVEPYGYPGNSAMDAA